MANKFRKISFSVLAISSMMILLMSVWKFIQTNNSKTTIYYSNVGPTIKVIALIGFITFMASIIMWISNHFVMLHKFQRLCSGILIFNLELITFYSHGSWIIHVCIVPIIYLLLVSYDNKLSQQKLFILGILVGILILYYSSMIYLLPITVLSLYILRANSIRNIFTIILGIFIPIWIYLPIKYFSGENIVEYLEDLSLEINNLSFIFSKEYVQNNIQQVSILCVLIILNLMASIINNSTIRFEKIKISKFFSTMNLFAYLFLLGSLILPNKELFLSIATIPTSLLLARSIGCTRNGKQTTYIIIITSLLLLPICIK